jgi:hypothetical protein
MRLHGATYFEVDEKRGQVEGLKVPHKQPSAPQSDTSHQHQRCSALRYVFDIKEDCNGRKRYKPEEIVAKLRQVNVLGLTKPEQDGRNPPDRCERGDVLSTGAGVRWAEDRAVEAA